MYQLIRIAVTSFKMALQELRANKLRTILSLLGVTIGIFCIVAVSTVLDSLEKNIRTNVASLGNDVVYVSKWPWTDEGGEYKWWEYWRRPVPQYRDLRAVRQGQTVRYATLCFSEQGITARHDQYELGGIVGYAVTEYFEKMQNFEVASGRYLNAAELNGGHNTILLGSEVAAELFPGQDAISGKTVTLLGRKFTVIGTLKKMGDNIAGFNFDRGVIFPYFAAASVRNVNSLDANATMMIKARPGINSEELGYETEGILRAAHRLQPGARNDFSINKLSQITERLDKMFATIDTVGWVIALFSLLVGAFGIANIMFVSVKERTKMIGLKKAVGARRPAILTEFLIEAITLCLLGGMAGIVIVLLLSLVMTYAAGFPITLSFSNFMTGITVSTCVGVLAGYIPARAASRLDPVVAIRST